jgi:hypothetical protein
MDVRGAKAGRLDLDAHLPRSKITTRHLLDRERLAKPLHHGGAVRAGDRPADARLLLSDGHQSSLLIGPASSHPTSTASRSTALALVIWISRKCYATREEPRPRPLAL